jgi:geranylgeranyl diphosphate synthase type I
MNYVDLVNRSLGEIFANEPGEIKDLVHYHIASGGKRLRPTLCILVCQALGGKIKDALPYGLTVEILHNLSLILDDIMDKDTLRRGKKPLYLAFGLEGALMTANYLTYRAFEVLSQKVNPEALRELAFAAKMTCLGQMFESKAQLSEKDYLRLCELKTGYQFYVSAVLGAIAAHKGKMIAEKAGTFGKNMGLAFQIQDDILNFEGTQDKFGKPILSDAEKRKPNYVLVCAYRKMGEDLFEGSILDNIASAGAIEEARKKAHQFVDHARSLLPSFPKTIYRQRLSLLLDTAVERSV